MARRSLSFRSAEHDLHPYQHKTHDLPLAETNFQRIRTLTSTTNNRLLAAQFNFMGISPTNYDYYTDNYCKEEVRLTNTTLGPATPLNATDIDPLLIAYDCSLYFCLQEYTAETTAGEPGQDLVSIWDHGLVRGFRSVDTVLVFLLRSRDRLSYPFAL
jgi:hypothetical protein